MDQLIKAIAYKEQVRILIVNNTNCVNTAIKKHDLWPSSASVLGKTMTMGLLMGGMLKDDCGVTIKLNGNGYIGNVIVDCNSKGDVRGYVDNPHLSFINNDGGINDAITIGNDGFIDVIKDLKLKDFFTSSIALTGNLAYDFANYFMESEQTRSAINFGIKIETDNLCSISGGFIIQLLPNATEEVIKYLENRLQNFKHPSEIFKNYSLEEIIEMLFDDDYKILYKENVNFKCSCSKEGFKNSLLRLNKKQLKQILDEDHKIETVCHYCNSKYLFEEKELIEVLDNTK